MHKICIASFDEAAPLGYVTVDLSPAQDELGFDPEIAQHLVVDAAAAQSVPFDMRHGWSAYYLRKSLTNSEL